MSTAVSTNIENESMVLEAASPEAARSQAAEQWGVSEDDIKITVLDEGKRLFGLLGKKMKVQVETKTPIMYLRARDFASALMERLDLDLATTLDDENMLINLDGEDSAIMIGRHGETLKALEFITNLIYRADPSTSKIRFDCGGYRVRREESLVRLAESVAREVIRKNAPIGLEPMSSWERRVIHVALQDNADISTCSEGEEPLRRIVIQPSDYVENRRSHHRRHR